MLYERHRKGQKTDLLYMLRDSIEKYAHAHLAPNA